MATYNGVVILDVSWSGLKSFAISKNLAVQYDESATAYEIFCIDGNIGYKTIIFKGAVPNTIDFNQTTNDSDKSNFETNYKDIITNQVVTQSAIVDGYAVTTASPTLIAGSDGSFIKTLRSDTSGRLVTVGLGTAGTPAGGLVTIQGDPSGTPIPISVGTTNDIVASGTIAANGTSVTTSAINSSGSVGIQVSGTWVGTIAFEGSVNGVTYNAINVRATNIGTIATTTTTNNIFRLSVAGLQFIRCRSTAWTSGTATVTIRSSVGTNALITESLPTGANVIGAVTISGTPSVSTTSADTNAVGTFNALNAAATVAIADKTSVGFRLTAGTFIGTIIPEVSLDGGTTWSPTLFDDLSTGVKESSIVFSSNNTVIQKTIILAGGASNARVRVSAFTSGTAAANIRATRSNDPSVLFTGNNNGTLPLTVGQMGGSDGTNLRAFRVASDGTVRTDPTGTTTQPISATSLPLPTGAATETTLATLLTESTFTSRINTLGQKTSSNSTPVVLASDQSAIPISGSITANNDSVSATGVTPPSSATYVAGVATTAAPSYTTGQLNALSLTTVGALRIDGSAVTQPVSGTITANAGTGNFTVIGPGASGAAVSGNPVRIAGSDGTNTRNIITDTSGRTVIVGPGVNGAAVVGNPVLVAGFDGTNTQIIRTSGAGGLVLASDQTPGNAVPGTAIWFGASDGTNLQGLRGSTTAPAGTEFGLITRNIPSGTQAISGTVTVAQATAANLRSQTASEFTTATTTGTVASLTGGSVTTAAPTYTTGQMNLLSLTTAGALRTDSSSTTQPVSGTVTANQGGTWNITNVSGTVSLPTGAATETSLARLTLAQSSTTSGQFGSLHLAAVTTAAPTYTTGQSSPLSLDTTGALRVNVTTGGGSNASVSTTGTTPPSSATYIGASVTTAAPTYTTGQMSALSLTTTGLLRVDGSAVTQPVSGTITANAGTGNFTVVQATAGNLNATVVGSGNFTVVQSTAANLRSQTASEATTAAATGTVASLTGGAVTTAAPTYTTGQMNPLSLTTAGALRIDGSGSTQPVSGTLATTQSGTWTIQPGNTANTTPWLATINQGGNSATVKAANTAAVATDPALVVAISPNNPLTVSGTADTTASGTLNSLNAVATIALAGQIGVGFQLAAGTFIGAIIPEISYDGGTTWVTTQFYDPTTYNKVGSIIFAASNTATARSIIAPSGASHARVRVSTFTSGTAACSIRASQIINPCQLDIATAGSALPPAITQMGGSVTTTSPTYTNGTLNAISLTTSGAVRVDNRDTSDPFVTGTLSALNAVITISCAGNYTIGGTITGTWVGTITAQGTVDGTNWFTVRTANKSTNDIIQTYTANDSFEFYSVAGCTQVRLNMTAYTSGTATVTLAGTSVATDAFLNYSSVDNDVAPPSRYVNIATLSNDGTSHSLRNTNIAPTGTEYALVTRSIMEAVSGSSFVPDQGNILETPRDLSLDVSGNLLVRGQVLTDEGSIRDDFTGSALTSTLTGTVNFTAASTIVTGTGTTFTTQVRVGQYIKKTADSETLYVQIDSIQSDTALTLKTAYAGTTAGATSVVSNWQTVTGGALTVATSTLTIGAGTTAAATTSIKRLADFLPCSIQFYASISQRIANQTFFMGLQDITGLTPNQQATIQFTGTDNTKVNFVTSFANTVSDTQTTLVTIPNGGNTSTFHVYKIDLSQNQATLSIDGIIVCVNSIHIPSPYTSLYIDAGVTNAAAPATNTNLVIDYTFFQNINRVQVDHDFNGEPMPIQGSVVANLVDGTKATYSATFTGLVVAATPTDIFTISGSATKTIRINKFSLTASQTTSSQRLVSLIKRTTANTAGTSTTATIVSYDSINAAATAVVRGYTVNPTALGTSAGTIKARKVFIGTATSNSDEFVLDFGIRNNQALVLRGTAEFLCVNLNSVTSTGNSFDISIEWTEE